MQRDVRKEDAGRKLEKVFKKEIKVKGEREEGREREWEGGEPILVLKTSMEGR